MPILALLFLLLLPLNSWAAIALDGTPTGTTGTSVSSLTWSFTCTTGSVYLVSVGNLGNGANTITSVTYNSVTLTELYQGDNSGVEAKLGLYMAVTGCDGAAHNIVATISASGGGYMSGGAAAYSGVVTSSVAAAHRTVYNGGDAGGGGTVTVTDSASGDYVVAGIAGYNGTLTATGTSRVLNTGVGGGNYNNGLQDYAASGASTVTSWTSPTFFTQAATALIPGASGSETFGFRLRLRQ